MNKLLIFVVGLISISATIGQVMKPVDEQSSVKFRIRNFGFNVTGSFKGLQGNINYFPERLNESSVDVTVQANTVNTDIDLRDNHLRKPEYFDVK